MNVFGERLKVALKNKNMKQSVLAYRLNVDRSYITNWINGKYKPTEATQHKIAEVLNVSLSWLLGIDTPANAPKPKVPVLGYVAAGIPIEAIEDILDYEDLSPEMVKDGSEYFALKIKGESMEPKISDGDVVIVRKQEDVDSGQIAIVGVNGEEATCKKVMKQEGGILLQPLNPTFATVFYTVEQIESIPITILGRVVELRAKF